MEHESSINHENQPSCLGDVRHSLFYMRRLTGKYRIRKVLFGWQIKVEVYKTVCDFVGDESPDIKVWRKARVEDLIELGINCA
jgi:hypothetical protein